MGMSLQPSQERHTRVPTVADLHENMHLKPWYIQMEAMKTADLTYNIGLQYFQMKDYMNAEKYLGQSFEIRLALLSKNGLKYGMGKIHLQLGLLHYALGRHELAIRFLHGALRSNQFNKEEREYCKEQLRWIEFNMKKP